MNELVEQFTAAKPFEKGGKNEIFKRKLQILYETNRMKQRIKTSVYKKAKD